MLEQNNDPAVKQIWLEAPAVRFIGLTLQLIFVALLAYSFQIENRATYEKIIPMAVIGAGINHFLPLPWRIWWFCGVSAAGIVCVFGLQGFRILALGLLLIGAANAGRSFVPRLIGVLLLGTLFALLRSNIIFVPWSSVIWPILGSMFMFRLSVYMLDRKHAVEPQSWGHTLAYFFCLPNAVFSLFPVLDYAAFRKSHYSSDALTTYQRGVSWMMLGLAHILLYRFVYQQVVIDPESVETLSDLVRYLVSNMLLYLRVSGTFHLIIGILHLFGFRLAEAHRLFFLPSSFSDFWRRINIYWKDYMMKLVFYPVYSRLKNAGERFALAGATLAVFLVTWLLHSYQSFWVLGKFHFSWTDGLFWSILCALLLGSSFWELRRGRARTVAAPRFEWGAALTRGISTSFTMGIILFLWGLWSSVSLADFIGLITVQPPDLADALSVVAVLGAIGGASVLLYRVTLTPTNVAGGEAVPRSGPVSAILLLCAFIGSSEQLAAVVPGSFGAALRSLRADKLNSIDANMLQRSYYEKLQGINKFSGELWGVLDGNSKNNWTGIRYTPAIRDTDTLLQFEPVPNYQFIFHGEHLSINRWGMRDRDYEKQAQPGIMRIVVLGPSYVMGNGVADDETFEAVLERRLNREKSGIAWKGFEILNFAVPRYGYYQDAYLLESGKASDFKPDAVFLAGHPYDYDSCIQWLHEEVRRGRAPVDDQVRDIILRSGVHKNMSLSVFRNAVLPYQKELMRRGMERVMEQCRRLGIPAYFLLIPTPIKYTKWPMYIGYLMVSAKELGFILVDLSRVYGREDPTKLIVAKWDDHPNKEGHLLIANRLYDALMKTPQFAGLVSGGPKER